MCRMLSWKEVKVKEQKEPIICYLNDDCLQDAKGKELLKYLGDKAEEDLPGHGAIDYYWMLKGRGVSKEVNEPLHPDMLPKQIAKDVKNCKFKQFGTLECLLNAKGKAEYLKVIRKEFWKLFADTENRIKAWK